MFNFLKKLFSGPEEEQVSKEEIKVDELENWFKGNADKIFKELGFKINHAKTNIKDEIVKAKDNLAVLSTASLHNPKISVKEKQFMEGNRSAYILGVNGFLRNIDIGVEDYSKLLDFCYSFSVRLDKFGKSTVRPYHILQEFFAHESRDVAINIKNLGIHVTAIRSAIENANISKIDDVKNMIVELKAKIKQKTDIGDSLSDKEKTKEGLVRNKGEIEKALEKLHKSKEYDQLNELKAEKESVLVSLREHNAKIVHAFSVMERSLRKLSRVVVEDSELLQKYIDHPVEALVNDDNFKIIGLLAKLEKNINNLTLELKDKKREKVLETVKGLTEEFLREFVNKHRELDNKLGELERRIDENETLKKEKKLDYELSNFQDNLEKVSTEILDDEQELSKIDIAEMKNNLGKEINELLKVDVVIS